MWCVCVSMLTATSTLAQKPKHNAKPAQTDTRQQPADKTPPPAETPPAPAKPKVRTITAFIHLDPVTYPQQIDDTLAFLKQAKSTYEKAGYEVQTLRIATQPFPEYTRDLSDVEAFKLLRDLDRIAEANDFLIAVGPAMQHIGDHINSAVVLARALAPATHMSGSVTIAAEDGIHWDAVEAAALVVEHLSQHSPKSKANFGFASAAFVPPGTPFFPVAYNSGNDHQFAVGLQSASVVAEALASTHDPAIAERAIVEKLGGFAKNIEEISHGIAQSSDWKYEGMDLSPAPLKRDSIGAAIESFTGAWFGSSGTLMTAALITRAVQSIPVTRIGYSGLMLPVMEDATIAHRWSEGSVSLDGLLSYSAVCGIGLDVVPLPGRITHAQLVRILADVASLSIKWHKPLSARLLPIAGKDAGDRTEFDDPMLVNTMIRPLP